jgi:hypothetical protein
MLCEAAVLQKPHPSGPGAYFPGSNGRSRQSGFALPGAPTPTVDRDKSLAIADDLWSAQVPHLVAIPRGVQSGVE